jgi:lipopolysaccharide transport system ATP-binding protein
MTDIALKVEHLGKKYRLRAGDSDNDIRYWTLRDNLARLGHKAAALFSPKDKSASAAPSKNSDFWALDDVSFEVRKGEIIGLIGHNGAGKSTLLKLLSRITDPTTGRVEINGRVASLLEVGTGFNAELTGRENIYLNGAILGMKHAEIRAQFDKIVEFAEVAGFIDMPIKRYSSGMFVRLAFAVAAHLQTEILIIDEVLAVGDTKFQKRCLQKMQDVARSGNTVFLVSHQMQLVQSFATRCLLLKSGKLVSDGHPLEVISEYLGQKVQSIDLSRFPRKGKISGRFTSLSFTAATNTWPDSVAQGSPLTAHIEFELLRPVKQTDIAVTFYNSSNIAIFTSYWSDSNPRLDLAEGRHRFSIQIPTRHLRPDIYWLSLYLSGAHTDHVDSVNGLAMPPIIPSASEDKIVEAHRAGVVLLSCDWQQASN